MVISSLFRDSRRKRRRHFITWNGLLYRMCPVRVNPSLRQLGTGFFVLLPFYPICRPRRQGIFSETFYRPCPLLPLFHTFSTSFVPSFGPPYVPFILLIFCNFPTQYESIKISIAFFALSDYHILRIIEHFVDFCCCFWHAARSSRFLWINASSHPLLERRSLP